jgi:pimeloyl-ACP methyl ester carboxylesterase
MQCIQRLNIIALAIGALLLPGCAILHEVTANAYYPKDGPSIDGVYYKTFGSGLPVVCFHGSPGTMRDFPDVLVQDLAKDHRVILVDIPGYGHSFRGKSKTLEEVSEKIDSVLTKLGVERPIIVGYSWGGALALIYAAKVRTDIRGLVLVSPVAFPDDKLVDWTTNVIATPVIGDVVLAVSVPQVSIALVRERLKKAAAPEKLTEGYVHLSSTVWSTPCRLRTMALDGQRTGPALQEAAPLFKNIECPVQVLVGSEDKFVCPDRHGRRLSAQLRRATLTEVAQAGHILVQTKPEVVAAAVRAVAGATNAQDRNRSTP